MKRERKKEGKERHWADRIADRLIELNPKKKVFVCAAGVTPSGTVHIGNFRDIITSDLICRALKDRGKKSRLIFSWDDYDRFRKVPAGVPKSFSKYIGMPVSKVPDPFKCHSSYAEHFEKEFERTLPELGIKPNFVYQTKEYERNRYYKEIKMALQKRKQIAKILSEFKTQKLSVKDIENYFPFQIYCRKCRKDTTKIIDYDGENKIIYSCRCGYKEEVNLKERHTGKLSWRVDWAARWAHYKVVFEPGGKDHATPGGSYDTSKKLAEEIFNYKAPLFLGYEFVGIRGKTSKISGSAGGGVTPGKLLEIYESELLRWLFTKTHPKRTISFCFDSELIRQYNEFDSAVEKYLKGKLAEEEKRALIFAKVRKEFTRKRIPFRQVSSFGQIAQGNLSELKKMFKRMGQEFDERSLKQRLEKSQNWVKEYARELEIKIRNKPNKKYYNKLSKEEKSQIGKLIKGLDRNWTLKKLTFFIYEIPKKPKMLEEEKKERQRRFFRNVYQMLIDSDTGPRLPTFLLALGKKKVKKLLKTS